MPAGHGGHIVYLRTDIDGEQAQIEAFYAVQKQKYGGGTVMGKTT